MNRKQFLKSMAAVAGSLAIPGSARAADFRAALQARPRTAMRLSEAHPQRVRPGSRLVVPELRRPGHLPDAGAQRHVGVDPHRGAGAQAGHDETLWWSVKERLARLLGPRCRKEDLALIGCATEGVNAIINGLPLKKGDEVIVDARARGRRRRAPQPDAA